ncbi:MAG: DUF1385 domain-containing protein [Nitrospirae bacterium]|nr:DUF1385 domain-containing protein [Nitrospirota bacterium]
MRQLLSIPPKIIINLYQILSAGNRKSVGGQAVIEGVMMRSPRRWSVAVRGPDNKIYTKTENLNRPVWLFRLPLIRGSVALIQSIRLGIKAIEFSASKAIEEDEQISGFGMFLTIALSSVVAIAVFIFLPLYLTRLLSEVLHTIGNSNILFNLTDGLFRVIIFIAYVFLIGLWPEMKRIFQYHGAEHKSIHAYEKTGVLEPEEVLKNYSPLHPRCGTSFLLIVMVTSILVFSFIPEEWSVLYKFLARVALIPLIAGVSYEILKYSAKGSSRALLRPFVLPGLWLQRLTTKEPTLDQVEVAITALKEATADGDA